MAKSNYDRAVTNYSIKENQFANGEIRSNFNGYVKVVYVEEVKQIEKNEPVISIGSTNA